MRQYNSSLAEPFWVTHNRRCPSWFSQLSYSNVAGYWAGLSQTWNQVSGQTTTHVKSLSPCTLKGTSNDGWDTSLRADKESTEMTLPCMAVPPSSLMGRGLGESQWIPCLQGNRSAYLKDHQEKIPIKIFGIKWQRKKKIGTFNWFNKVAKNW